MNISLHSLRIRWCPNGASKGKWRRHQQELVDIVPSTIICKHIKIEHLTKSQAHVGNSDLVQWLKGIRELAGTYLQSPGVTGNGCNLCTIEPVKCREGESWRIPSSICSPTCSPGLAQLPCTYEHNIT